MNNISKRKRIVDMDVVNYVTSSRDIATTLRVVICFLWHDVILWITATSCDKMNRWLIWRNTNMRRNEDRKGFGVIGKQIYPENFLKIRLIPKQTFSIYTFLNGINTCPLTIMTNSIIFCPILLVSHFRRWYYPFYISAYSFGLSIKSYFFTLKLVTVHYDGYFF